ncbi:MAG: hypothetical protein V2I36_07035 [Desulfopila sp.]|nr:hypothetical protein [Desulfopila sp.]
MAPARMIQFIKNHAATCETCLADPDLSNEIEKITELILPESKIPKAVRLQQEKDDLEAAEDEEDEDIVDEDEDEEEDTDSEEEEEDEEYMDDEDDIDDEDFGELN